MTIKPELAVLCTIITLLGVASHLAVVFARIVALRKEAFLFNFFFVNHVMGALG
jgi:hypothetical protein